MVFKLFGPGMFYLSLFTTFEIKTENFNTEAHNSINHPSETSLHCT